MGLAVQAALGPSSGRGWPFLSRSELMTQPRRRHGGHQRGHDCLSRLLREHHRENHREGLL